MINSELWLIAGMDGVGKSTLIKELKNELPERIVDSEPTSSHLVKKFREKNFNRHIDVNFVEKRKEFFLGIQRETDEKLNGFLKSKANIVATSGSTLVTHIAHTAMFGVLGKNVDLQTELSKWQESSDLKPSRIILLCADLSTSLKRLNDRVNSGNQHEIPWGFNSPYYLARYQEYWTQAVNIISDTSQIYVDRIDTGDMLPEEIALTVLNPSVKSKVGKFTTDQYIDLTSNIEY